MEQIMRFETFDALRGACRDLPGGDRQAAVAATRRQAELAKPPGSLGRLEDLAEWIACWQGAESPRLDHVTVIIFAGSHGVAARGVSAFPADVTAQMVANFSAGGAAINQLAASAGADLRVIPIALAEPTADFTRGPAMSEREFLDAVALGWNAVPVQCQLLAVGEMGIGNTTAASALCAALAGGDTGEWVGRGTGVDDDGVARKRAIVDAGLVRHQALRKNAIAIAAALGGRELAALLGAVLGARHRSIPVLLDGFVVCAAVLPLAVENAEALAHCRAGHRSAEAAHGRLLARLALSPLLDLGMRLGEGSGAALAIHLVRAALVCHNDMATFTSAGVSTGVSG